MHHDLKFETLNMLRSYARSIGLLLVRGAASADGDHGVPPPVEPGITPARRAKLHLAAHLLAQAADTALPLTCPICVSGRREQFHPGTHLAVFHQPPIGPDEALSEFLRALPSAGDEDSTMGRSRRAINDALLDAPAEVVEACHAFAERELDRLREIAVVAFAWRATVHEHSALAAALSAVGFETGDGETLPQTFKRAWESVVAPRSRGVEVHEAGDWAEEVATVLGVAEDDDARIAILANLILDANAGKVPEHLQREEVGSKPKGGFTPRKELSVVGPARFDGDAPPESGPAYPPVDPSPAAADRT